MAKPRLSATTHTGPESINSALEFARDELNRSRALRAKAVQAARTYLYAKELSPSVSSDNTQISSFPQIKVRTQSVEKN